MNKDADGDHKGEAHLILNPLFLLMLCGTTTDYKFHNGKNSLAILIVTSTPGTVPDTQEVHNNFLRN